MMVVTFKVMLGIQVQKDQLNILHQLCKIKGDYGLLELATISYSEDKRQCCVGDNGKGTVTGKITFSSGACLLL